MPTIKHILFPVDFSDQSKAVAPAVEAMAARFGAEVTLLSVMQPYLEYANNLTPFGEMAMPTPMVEDLARLKESLESRLAGSLVEEFAQTRVKRVVEIGDPAHTITQYAKSKGADMIMIPTHGLGPFRTLLLGSVAAKVLHDAECPVWTAAHALPKEGYESMRGVRCESILCALDTAPKCSGVMGWAVDYAARCGAQLRFVHVVRGGGAWPGRQMDREFEQVLVEEGRKQIENQMKTLGVQAPLDVELGDVADVVAEQALKREADLVIIGRGVLNETLGRLRSHAYAIIRSAPCPVLSV